MIIDIFKSKSIEFFEAVKSIVSILYEKNKLGCLCAFFQAFIIAFNVWKIVEIILPRRKIIPHEL